MRRLLRLWLVVASLLLTTLPGTSQVLAQNATPGPADGPITNVPNPQIGDMVSYISQSGDEVARLRVTDVVLDWDEYSEYYVPSPASQYVAVVVEVTNFGTRGALVVRADDFRLQDVDGFLYARSWAEADSGAELRPAESEVGVGSGDTEELVLVYEVITGVQLSNFYWQPDYDRMLTVADLSEYQPGS